MHAPDVHNQKLSPLDWCSKYCIPNQIEKTNVKRNQCICLRRRFMSLVKSIASHLTTIIVNECLDKRFHNTEVHNTYLICNATAYELLTANYL